MRRPGPISEAEMVAVFLRTEIASARFGGCILAALARDGRDRALVNHPDTSSAVGNAYWRAVLGECRGFGRDAALFEGFPDDVRWQRALASKGDLAAVRSIKYDYWIELSGGSRLAPDAADRIRQEIEIFRVPNDGFWRVADAIKAGATFPELILVGADEWSPLVVLEGHVRLIAYFLRPETMPPALPAIVGYSTRMADWSLYSPAPHNPGR